MPPKAAGAAFPAAGHEQERSMAEAASVPARDVRVMSLIGLAHGVSHFFQLVLPPLFPLVKDALGFVVDRF
jgi:hypothetical protein